MRYWLYKCNVDGGPAGYWGEWSEVFGSARPVEWGGSYSTCSAAVQARLDDDVSRGDVITCYQTDETAVVGFCVVEQISGAAGSRKLYLRPIEWLTTPLHVHEVKRGTVLEESPAVGGRVMLAELDLSEMKEIVRLASAPPSVLQGKPSSGGYRPIATREA